METEGIGGDCVNQNDKKKEIVSHQAIEATLGGDGDTGLTTNGESKSHVMEQEQPRKRVHRVLHFSDGIVEEFSDDDDEYQVDSAPAKLQEPPVDPKTLAWGPWFLHQTLAAGGAALKVCDYLGESLANIFGITRPKYEYEIEEYKRTMQQEEERQKKEDLEMGGWRDETVKVPQVEEPGKADAAERLSLLRLLLSPFFQPKISCV